jgi:hypothetical protein
MNRYVILACALAASFSLFAAPWPDGLVAVGMVAVLAAPTVLLMRKYTDEKSFITTVFLLALAVRLGFGAFIAAYDLRGFFGGDFAAYDMYGAQLVDEWLGRNMSRQVMVEAEAGLFSGAGWGMHYLTAIIYLFVGRNVFAAQSFCGFIGAATVPMVFFCARKIFSNLSVAKASAVAIALFPSFIIWSSQLLKDGLIIFLLVVAMTMVLQLQQRFSYVALAALIGSMFGILSIRFYIFYMVAVAVVGSFIVGLSTTKRSILRSTIVLAMVGFGLSYLGVGRQANVEISTFANLQRIQTSRSDLSQTESGFGQEIDVSTTEGALSAIPLGFAYLMFAPFPWQVANVRQAITIPEVLFWWAMMPFLVVGLIYTIRHRLRNAFPILIFSLLLTISYSVFQGNVGTAYRQRTQIQVFLFILIGVGYTVFLEYRENQRLIQSEARRRLESNLAGGHFRA